MSTLFVCLAVRNCTHRNFTHKHQTSPNSFSLFSSIAHVREGVSCTYCGEHSFNRFLSAGLPSLSKRTDSEHHPSQNPQGAVRAPGQLGLRTHRSEDEYPGSART